MKVELEYLGGDKLASFTDGLLHACDLFNSSKRFVIYDRLTIHGTPDLDKLCERVASCLKEVGGYAVFVAIRKVDGKRGNWPIWFERDINSIAMAQGWTLFRDILQQLDYNVETDESMKVIAIS